MTPGNKFNIWKDSDGIHFTISGSVGKYISLIILSIIKFILYPFTLIKNIASGNKSKLDIDNYLNSENLHEYVKPIDIVISHAGNPEDKHTFNGGNPTFKVKMSTQSSKSVAIEDDHSMFLGEVGISRVPTYNELPMKAIEVWIFDIHNDNLSTLAGTIHLVDYDDKQSNYLMFMKNSLAKKPEPLITKHLSMSVVITNIYYENDDPVFGNPINVEFELEVTPI